MGRRVADFVGVIVAAGAASRFGGETPKQFCEIGGRTVLERSVRALTEPEDVAGTVVVLAREELGGPRAEAIRACPGVLAVVAGGATRCDSVRAGFDAVPPQRFVLVHDAARPLASRALIESVMEATRRHGAAIPALLIPDTVKQIDASGAVVRTVDRRSLRLAQTPQGARHDWLRQALAAVGDAAAMTDEAALLESTGRKVAVVPGDPRNRKITTMQDLEDLRSHGAIAPTLRVGTGFDIHRSGAERELVLGGVRFPGEPGLVGHSDADVVLHAAMDALLGAAALGDIGQHFPPDDPAYAGADSGRLAGRVAAMIRERGWEIVNLDLTLLAERPKIRPRVEEMRAAIAGCLGVEPTQVGLKATTLERLGALGRAEGLACEAIACIRGAADPGKP